MDDWLVSLACNMTGSRLPPHYTNPSSRPFNACFSAVLLSPNDRTLPPMQLSISTLLVDVGSRDQ